MDMTMDDILESIQEIYNSIYFDSDVTSAYVAYQLAQIENELKDLLRSCNAWPEKKDYYEEEDE